MKLKRFNDYTNYTDFKENLNSRSKIYYGFENLPNRWSDDYDRNYTDDIFIGKDYEEYHFDNFLEMDKMFGHENSLFGTRGLKVGDPKRSSKSFDMWNKQYGPAIVRVVK